MECILVLRKYSLTLVSSHTGLLHVFPKSLEKEVNNLSNETHIQYKIEFSIIKDGKVYNDGSVIKQEQILVLGSSSQVQPRVVDTFSKVCDFKQCGGNSNTNNASANNSGNNCNCQR